MRNTNNQMGMVWIAEQDILNVIDIICRQNTLRYSLAFGTLLGAVRHGGFIPWDDDIDIMMPREDYEKLLSIWKKEAPDDYILQNKWTNRDFTQNFSKICKDHTTFLQEEEERTKTYHKGIFVDIFPVDRVAPGRFLRMAQYAACAVNLLYSRGFTSESGGMIGMVERILICFPEKIRRKLWIYTGKFIQRWNGNTTLSWFVCDDIHDTAVYHTSELFEQMTELTFSKKKYPCTALWDVYLTTQYGDYMQLPPTEERVWKHTPLLVDFEHNYEELENSSD